MFPLIFHVSEQKIKKILKKGKKKNRQLPEPAAILHAYFYPIGVIPETEEQLEGNPRRWFIDSDITFWH